MCHVLRHDRGNDMASLRRAASLNASASQGTAKHDL